MLTLLHRFAALTLTLAVLSWLLPEGSVRRTAMLAAGVAMAAAGTLILFLTLGRRDRLPEESA